MMLFKRNLLVGFIISCVALSAAFMAAEVQAADCTPTRTDALGPYYEPGAPARDKVGSGYVLEGTVRSTKNCTEIAGASIEFWMAGPDGSYQDRFRATVIADDAGGYRFESPFPGNYEWRPPHIHIRVSAPGHRVLVTQHYPEEDAVTGSFDLVLVPER
jgi:protocatechuate 3,4-dioxygenase beta subunit